MAPESVLGARTVPADPCPVEDLLRSKRREDA